MIQKYFSQSSNVFTNSKHIYETLLTKTKPIVANLHGQHILKSQNSKQYS